MIKHECQISRSFSIILLHSSLFFSFHIQVLVFAFIVSTLPGRRSFSRFCLLTQNGTFKRGSMWQGINLFLSIWEVIYSGVSLKQSGPRMPFIDVCENTPWVVTLAMES